MVERQLHVHYCGYTQDPQHLGLYLVIRRMKNIGREQPNRVDMKFLFTATKSLNTSRIQSPILRQRKRETMAPHLRTGTQSNKTMRLKNLHKRYKRYEE